MPVILATQEAEIRRIMFQRSVPSKWFRRPYFKKKKITKKKGLWGTGAGGVAQAIRALAYQV
jgi:hypothetical protein